jgi:hypothetical protein
MLYTVENCDSRYGAIRSAVSRVRRDNVGCKPKYKNAAELSEAVDKFFEDCKGHTITDSKGVIITDKNGVPVIIGAHPPTVTGLALALGFKTRQSLLDYQARSDKFNDIITVAKSRCEEYAERRLYDRDGVNGAKFSLTNNFKGWREKPLEDTSDALSKLDEVLSKIGGGE